MWAWFSSIDWLAVMTGVLAIVTTCMAIATWKMAKEARAQLKFMKDEAHRKSAASIVEGKVAMGGGTDNWYQGDISLCNAGPGAAHNLKCHGWMVTDESRANLVDFERKEAVVEAGAPWEPFLEFAAPPGQGISSFHRGGLGDFKFLVTWWDEENRPYAWVKHIIYPQRPEDQPVVHGRAEDYHESVYWPEPRQGEALNHDDPLVDIRLQSEELLAEVEKRLSAVPPAPPKKRRWWP